MRRWAAADGGGPGGRWRLHGPGAVTLPPRQPPGLATVGIGHELGIAYADHHRAAVLLTWAAGWRVAGSPRATDLTAEFVRVADGWRVRLRA